VVREVKERDHGKVGFARDSGRVLEVAQWAGFRETNLASGRGRSFFLTSLSITSPEVAQAIFVLVTNCAHLIVSP